MFNTSTVSCISPIQGTTRKYSALVYKTLMSFVLLFTLLASNSAVAQTVRQSLLTCAVGGRDACSSNDLQIVSVDIVSSGCISCTSGSVTFPLTMTIHNGTNSDRTSFALYGTLSAGAKITSNGVDYTGNIFICVGPITVGSSELLAGESAPGNQTFAVGTITFNCGQNLTLTNNFLKWTDASGETVPRCEELALKTS